MQRKYSWIPDLPDHRDKKFTAIHATATLPTSVDLRTSGFMPIVYDQNQLGSCTANACAGAYQFGKLKQKENTLHNSWIPSRLFIYYNERVIDGSVPTDAGSSLRTGIKVLNTQGACPETMWPYQISKFAVKPPQTCYTFSLKNEITSYLSIDNTNITALKSCLAAGYPFVMGFSVYESFESEEVATTGILPMPQPNESQLGGHAVVGVGYDDATQMFIIRNSWGKSWGLGGYFMMPYAYITNADLADDFWTIRMLE